MHLPQWVQKVIMSVLVVALLLPGVYVALTPQAPAEAQWFNTTIFDVTAIANFIKNIGDKIWEVTQIALDVALYKTVKYAVRQLGDQSAQWVGRTVSGGRVGQEPLFWEQTPMQMAEQAGEAAGGFFIEGLAEGIAVEQEMQKTGQPKSRVMKEKRGAILQQAQQIVSQMCNPDPRFRFDLLAGVVGNLSLSFGLPIPPFGLPPIPLTKKTEKPACTFTQAYTSWKKVATDTAVQFSEQLQNAVKTITDFPKAISEAFEQDKRDITDAFNRISQSNSSLQRDAGYNAKANALITTISNKLGIPTDLNTADLNSLPQKLSQIQTNLKKLPSDPDVKSNLEQVRSEIKTRAPDSAIQPRLETLKTYLSNNVYTTTESKAPLKRIFDTITGIDDPYIIDRLREMQGLASSNTQSEADFNTPLRDLLANEAFSSRALFNRAELVVKNLGNNQKVQSLIGNAQDATNQQLQADQEASQRRATGNLTGWQVLQDLADPAKASDITVQSKTQYTLNDFLAKMREAAVLQRTENNGIRPVTTLSGQITSPPLSVAALISGSIAGQVNQEGKFTGNAVVDAADLIGEFADSILGKTGQMIIEGFTKTNPDQPVAQQNKIGELAAAIGARPVVGGGPGAEGGGGGTGAGSSAGGEQEGQVPGGQTQGGSGATTPTDGRSVQDIPYPSSDDQGSEIGQETAINQGGQPPQPSSELITNPGASVDTVRRASIEARISKLVALPPSKEEQINVLGTLGSDCVPGTPDSCTIRPSFSQAIQQKLTIAESVARFKQTGGSSGLNENTLFGFKRGLAGGAVEPDISQGIPYSSMVILRKYRILPVGWEIAALYVRDHPGACGQQDCTLGYLMNQYSVPSSAFYKLIDPNWVLKAPAAKCMLKGYGPPIEQVGVGSESGNASTNENAQWICRGDPTLDRGSEGEPPNVKAKQCQVEYKIQPRSQICLDQQTCLDEDVKGNCKAYGYCLEEKKRWQFSGTECKKQYSSCLSFTNTTTGVTTSFLRDSLGAFGYGGACNESNAGCGWYSTELQKKDASSDGSQRSQYDWKESSKTYFTSRAKDFSCPAESEGCRALVKQDDLVNFAPQSDTLGNDYRPAGKNCGWQEGSWSSCPYGGADTKWEEVKNIQSPNGIIEPVAKLSKTTGTGDYRLHLHKASHGLDSVLGKTFTFSVWVKSSAASSVTLALGSDPDQGSSACATTQEWTRCSITHTSSTDASKYSRSDELRAYFYINASVDYYAYGAQVEQSPFATDYQKNTPQNRTGATHIKVAPAQYGCADNLTGSDASKPVGYKKDICKGFALHCPSTYAGCSSYIPANGDPAVAGITPIACNTSCIDMTKFAQVATQLETPSKPSYDFIPSAAQMCSAADVGCDEYTNIEGGAAGAEEKNYYSIITRCVKKLADPQDQRSAHQDVFYSWSGSETGGTQLEKFLLTSTNDDARSPVCWKNPVGASSCDCNAALNGPGRPLCRQFFRLNADGSPNTAQSWWRIQDDLVYVMDAADCTQYRRTLGGAGSTPYFISKSMSRSCPAASAGCREYHSTQAGNITALPPDTFNDKSIGKWTGGPTNANLILNATTEGETLGDVSLKATHSDTTKTSITIQKPVDLRSGSVIIGFAIKGPAGAKVEAKLYPSPSAGVPELAGETTIARTASSPSDDISGAWQYFQYAVSNVAIALGDSPTLRITLNKNNATSLSQFYVDDVVVRQSDGILYAIKSSWHSRSSASCYANAAGSATEKDWDTGLPDQLSCQRYRDGAGNEMTFQRFAALCPKEMIGCTTFVGGTEPLSLVNDPKKYCKSQDNKCTAYGQPLLDAKKAVIGYKNVYYKIAPGEIDPANPDYTRGLCKAAESECQEYATKYTKEYFKSPGADIARWRAAKDEVERDSYPGGVWYYTTCEGTTTRCFSDAQCSNGVKCNHEERIPATDMSLARLCPSDQSTCSKVVDPECRASDPAIPDYLTLRTNYGRVGGSGDSGITCQREYYYLDDVYAATGQCNGRVGVEKGCLLFQSDYPADGQGKKVLPKYDTDYIYRNDATDVNATGQSAKDANVLAKVKLDRACKTWLACSDEQVDATGHRTCTERRPCIELDKNGECANFADTENKGAMPELAGSFDTASSMKFAALSGLSRPEIRVKGASTNDSRLTFHDGFFDWGGNESTLKVPTKDVPAICRSYPQKDAPTASRDPNTKTARNLNECSYDRDGNEYRGLQGFCLEGYPKKGYEKYCLNWYPTDKPAGALPTFDSSAGGAGGKAFVPGNKPLAYCSKKQEYVLFGSDSTTWDGGRIVKAFCSVSDTACANDADCPSGQTCSRESLVKEGRVTPGAKTLKFTMSVKKDGSNICPAWGVTQDTTYHCSQWPTVQCTTLNSTTDAACTGQCNVPKTKTCNVPSGWSVVDANSCNTSGSCEVYRGSTCTTNTRVCDHNYSTSCPNGNSDCSYTVPQTCTRSVPRSAICAPSSTWNSCAKDWHDVGWECRYDNWACGTYNKNDPNQKWTECDEDQAKGRTSLRCPTIYKDVTYDCSYSQTSTCRYQDNASCSTASGEQIYQDSCHKNSSNYVLNTSQLGTCSVKKASTCSVTAKICSNNSAQDCSADSACQGKCIANTNAIKMSCNVNSRSQEEQGGVATLTEGNLDAASIQIEAADATSATVSIPLTFANIASFSYAVSENGTVKSGDTDSWGSKTIWYSTYGGAISNNQNERNSDVRNFYPPQKVCNYGGQEWYMIYPWFGNADGSLKGFKYALCASAPSVDRNFDVSVTIALKPQYYKSVRQTRQLKLTDNYCKEFTQVVDGAGNVIPTTRTTALPANLIEGVIDTTKPYSYSGGKEKIQTREYRLVATTPIPANPVIPSGSSIPSDSGVSADRNATYLIPTRNTLSQGETPLAQIRNTFVKIYNFFTLNDATKTYGSGLTSSVNGNSSTADFWATSISGNTHYPALSSRRCAQPAPDGSEVMCSATKICPNGKEDCGRNQTDIKSDTFVLSFPRESANQQIATMQFFTWTNAYKTPLRRLALSWGDGPWKNIYNSVTEGSSSNLDNRDGFAGKICETPSTCSDGEFTFLHTYPTTFWRNPTNAAGTNICVFTQDSWYFWKKVCGRFKRGGGGFIELDKTYNSDGFSGGWKTSTGKGNNSTTGANQPGP